MAISPSILKARPASGSNENKFAADILGEVIDYGNDGKADFVDVRIVNKFEKMHGKVARIFVDTNADIKLSNKPDAKRVEVADFREGHGSMPPTEPGGLIYFDRCEFVRGRKGEDEQVKVDDGKPDYVMAARWLNYVAKDHESVAKQMSTNWMMSSISTFNDGNTERTTVRMHVMDTENVTAVAKEDLVGHIVPIIEEAIKNGKNPAMVITSVNADSHTTGAVVIPSFLKVVDKDDKGKNIYGGPKNGQDVVEILNKAIKNSPFADAFANAAAFGVMSGNTMKTTKFQHGQSVILRAAARRLTNEKYGVFLGEVMARVVSKPKFGEVISHAYLVGDRLDPVEFMAEKTGYPLIDVLAAHTNTTVNKDDKAALDALAEKEVDEVEPPDNLFGAEPEAETASPPANQPATAGAGNRKLRRSM